MKKDSQEKLSPRPAAFTEQQEAWQRCVPFWAAGQPNATLSLPKGRFHPPSGARPMKSRRLADPNHSASVPLRGKPFEINGSSGSAELNPLFCKAYRTRWHATLRTLRVGGE